MVVVQTPPRVTCRQAPDGAEDAPDPTRARPFCTPFAMPNSAGLAHAWQGQTQWRILDAGFGDGALFFDTWQRWSCQTGAPKQLHYVALTDAAPDARALANSLAAYPALARHADEFVLQWYGLLPGFHRFLLDGARVRLTLCVGPPLASLRALQCAVDSIYLPVDRFATTEPTDCRWLALALARLSRRDTILAADHIPGGLRQAFLDRGFVVARAADAGTMMYQPHWEQRASRRRWRAAPLPVPSCIVIGAGLAGACAALALAQRGCSVTVLDRAATVANGASAAPVALLVPHTSRDDGPRSQIVRAGVRLSLQLCRRLLRHGVDWDDSGVLELRPDERPRLPPDWPQEGHGWSVPRQGAIWHPTAAWVKPARLVQECLRSSDISFVGNCEVASLEHGPSHWTVRDAAGQVLGCAAHVVLACGGDAAHLRIDRADRSSSASIDPHALRLQATDGQWSFARQDPLLRQRLPSQPVNGNGSFIPHIPHADQLLWFAGASFEAPSERADATRSAHQENRTRLQTLLPQLGPLLAGQWHSDQMQSWRGRRWSTADRLPLVGPLDQADSPNLWLSTAMGARGLSYCALCAELLAAQIFAEPPPLPARLARMLDVRRAAAAVNKFSPDGSDDL